MSQVMPSSPVDAPEETSKDDAPVGRFVRREIPWPVDMAAAWSWRILTIGVLIYWLYRTFAYFSEVTVPLAIAMLLSALLFPAVMFLVRLRFPRWLSAALLVLGLIGVVSLMLVLVGQQIADQARGLADKVVAGLDEIQVWLRDGPLHASDSQIESYLERAQEFIKEKTLSAEFVGTATEFGTAFGHIAAGVAIALFATYFFLADGERIWAYLVRFAPRAAQERLDGAGHVAWGALIKFVRATLLVAAADALGIALWAKALGLPLVLAIGVLVFLGAFIPMVGATLAGIVAVLVALVDGGPWTALWMLLGVIVVQQIEGHVLQPFLMGRLISVHPLGVIIALAGGIVLAGIAGALLAVPAIAVIGALVGHYRDHVADGLNPHERGNDPAPPRRRSPAHRKADPDPAAGDRMDAVLAVDPKSETTPKPIADTDPAEGREGAPE